MKQEVGQQSIGGQLLFMPQKKRPTYREQELIQKYSIPHKKIVFSVPVLICEIEDCIPITEDFIKAQSKKELDFGNWQEGNFAWKLKVIQILENVDPIRGQQGLWDINL